MGDLKICHVTTFWPVNRYGFAIYTDALIRGMRKTRPVLHFVAGEGLSGAAETEAYRCISSFRREDDYVEAIVKTVREVGADVALFQYSDDLFGEDDRFPRVLERLKEAGVATVVNTHSVFPADRRNKFLPGGTAGHLDRAIAGHAGRMMVHSQRMRQDLLDRGVPGSKIVVIPHGTPGLERRDRTESRRTLGVPEDCKLVMFFGFIWLGKGLDFLFDVFAELAKRVPDAHLYVGGHTRKKSLVNQAYMTYLKARLWWLGVSDRTHFWGDFVPQEMMTTLHSAADVVAFPYRQDYSSVSGVLHETAGIGNLMVCSDIAKFSEVGDSISPDLLHAENDKTAWVETLTRLLTDPAWADEIRNKVDDFASRTSWEAVGELHLRMFDELLRERQA